MDDLGAQLAGSVEEAPETRGRSHTAKADDDLVEIPGMDIDEIVRSTVRGSVHDVLGSDGNDPDLDHAIDLEAGALGDADGRGGANVQGGPGSGSGGSGGSGGGREPEVVHRPLSDMSKMELLMRDTRAYIAIKRADREVRQSMPVATACGVLLAILVQLFWAPIALIAAIFKVLRAMVPKSKRREAKVNPKEPWELPSSIKRKSVADVAGDSIRKKTQQKKKGAAVPSKGRAYEVKPTPKKKKKPRS
jgi:hypothetical protein